MNGINYDTKGELERAIDRRTADFKRFLIDEGYNHFEQVNLLKENDRLKRLRLIQFEINNERTKDEKGYNIG